VVETVGRETMDITNAKNRILSPKEAVMKRIMYLGEILMVLYALIMIFVLLKNGFTAFPLMYAVNEAADLVALIFLIIVQVHFIRRTLKNEIMDDGEFVFFCILMVNATGLFVDFFAWRVYGRPELLLANRILNFVYYFIGPVAIFTVWKYVKEIIFVPSKAMMKTFALLQWILFAGAEIAITLNVIFGFYYVIDDGGRYVRTPVTYYINFVPNIMMVGIILLAIFKSEEKPRNKISLVMYGLIPVSASALQMFVEYLSIQYIILTFSLVIVYLEIQTLRANELNEMRMRVVHSQMQPHFMYNGMTSIRALIRKDPDKAVEMMNHFMGYTRGALDMYEVEGLIPIEKELEFVRDYLEVECIRFGGKIRYDIEDEVDGFMVPPISVQPMVENAIKHGIRKKENGEGTVKIYTSEDENSYMVTVSDDGVGFDLSQKPEDGHAHIGVNNTRKRLKRMVNGELLVESIAGQGTKITLKIPKEKNQKTFNS